MNISELSIRRPVLATVMTFPTIQDQQKKEDE